MRDKAYMIKMAEKKKTYVGEDKKSDGTPVRTH